MTILENAHDTPAVVHGCKKDDPSKSIAFPVTDFWYKFLLYLNTILPIKYTN